MVYKVIVLDGYKSCPDEGVSRIVLRTTSSYQLASEWLDKYLAELVKLGFVGNGDSDLQHPKSSMSYSFVIENDDMDIAYTLEDFIDMVKDYMDE